MSNKNEEFKARILEVVEPDLLKEVDGFYYYFPNGTGFLTSEGLRVIADELDSRNKEWNDYISKNI